MVDRAELALDRCKAVRRTGSCNDLTISEGRRQQREIRGAQAFGRGGCNVAGLARIFVMRDEIIQLLVVRVTRCGEVDTRVAAQCGQAGLCTPKVDPDDAIGGDIAAGRRRTGGGFNG